MTAEPETTLVWAEFLWRVAQETPELVFVYIVLLDYVRRHYGHKPSTVDLGKIKIESASEIRAALEIATETEAALPIRVTKHVTLGVATETDSALPLRPA